MDKRYSLPPNIKSNTRAMVFVDGENLAIRYGEILGDGSPLEHVRFKRDVFVWSQAANHRLHICEVIRKYYYTSFQGDEKCGIEIEKELKRLGIEAPRVFKKARRKRSKRVDISLATDMLTHAHRKNYDVAILVAGDEDYVPLVEAVMYDGCRIVLWFFEDGLSPVLERKVDHSFDIARILLTKDLDRLRP